jgi:hypothetical protein
LTPARGGRKLGRAGGIAQKFRGPGPIENAGEEGMRVNYAAVVVAAVVNFLIGGLWYSPALFANGWIKLIGRNMEEMKRNSNPMSYVAAFGCSVAMAYVLAMFCAGQKSDSMARGAYSGLLLSAGVVATSMLTGYLFEERPLQLYLINAGYFLVGLTAMGAVLGGWKKAA